jgi:hypothetical protein
MAKLEKNFPVMAEPARSLSRLRRERLLIGDDGRLDGEVARGSRGTRLRVMLVGQPIEVVPKLKWPRRVQAGGGRLILQISNVQYYTI